MRLQLEYCVQFWTHQNTGAQEFLTNQSRFREGPLWWLVSQGTCHMRRGHTRTWTSSVWRREGLDMGQGTSWQTSSKAALWWEQPGSSQKCAAKGQEAANTNCIQGNHSWTKKKNLYITVRNREAVQSSSTEICKSRSITGSSHLISFKVHLAWVRDLWLSHLAWIFL